MNKLKTLGIAASFVVASASASSAATTAYVDLVDYNPGSFVTDPLRTNPANSYGAPDNKFLSLGIGGLAVFSFGTLFTGPGTIIEITNGSRAGYLETAKVYVGTSYNSTSNDISGFQFLTNITNAAASIPLVISGVWGFLAILDTSTPVGSTRDGFDVDSISVAAVPLPAGAVLLGSGMAALGFMGWRRKKATKLA